MRTHLRLACVAALTALAGCGGNRSATPDATGLTLLVDSLLPTLERVAGLEARAPVTVAVRSSDQVRAFVDARMREDFPPREIEAIRDVYSLLGLIPDTLDLGRLLADLYVEQIVGYYDPDSTTLYVIDGVSREALRPVLAHELVHALQDQHIDLDSLIDRSRGNDRQLAAQAAIEGHATLVMLALLAGEAAGRAVDPGELPDPGGQIRAGLDATTDYPVFRSAPRVLQEALIFPYAEGASFVWTIWANRPAGQRPPITALIPASTEQVLAPETKFLRSPDVPTDIAIETAADTAYELVYENTLGAFETSLFFTMHGGAAGAADGWDGDRYRLIEDGQGRRALLWWSVWDDTASADTFAAAARAALAQTPWMVEVRRADGGRPGVFVRIAGTGSGLDRVSAGALACPAESQSCVVR